MKFPAAAAAGVVAALGLLLPTQLATPATAGASGGDTTPDSHHLTVVRVHWTGSAVPDQPTAEGLAAQTARLSAYVDAVTGQQVHLDPVPAVTTWVEVPDPSNFATCGELKRAIFAAASAAAPSYADGPGTGHLFTYHPGTSLCTYAGQAGDASTGHSRHWVDLNGSLSDPLWAHEFGHSLGLGHANSRGCAPTQNGTQFTVSGICTAPDVEYGDPYDVMGRPTAVGAVGELSGDQQTVLGLTDGLSVVTGGTPAPTDYVLSPLTGPAAGTRLLRIHVGAKSYSLEYRTAARYDSWLANHPKPGTGVLLRVVNGTEFPLVVMRSGAPALQTGDTVILNERVTVTIGTLSETGASVSVSRTSPDADGPAVSTIGPDQDPAAGAVAYVVHPEDFDTGVAAVTLMVDGVEHDHVVPSVNYPFDVDATRVSATGLVPGSHDVTLRVTDYAGNVTEVPWTVTVPEGPTDPVDPAGPDVSHVRVTGLVRGDTVSPRSIPTTLQWTTDPAAGCDLTGHRLARGSRSWNVDGADRTAPLTLAPGLNTVQVQATDACGGHDTADSAVTRVAVDSADRVRHSSGKWTRVRGSRTLGPTDQISTRRGASITKTLRGSSLGWVATTGPGSGKALVKVDGRRVGVIDLRSVSTEFRQQVWTKTFPRAGRHRVTVVNLGTRGRPVVSVDGFVTLN